MYSEASTISLYIRATKKEEQEEERL